MRPIKKFLIVTAAEIALIAILHFVLLWWCAEGDVVSKAMFSPGKHTARIDLYITGLFLLVRLVAVLLLPGIVFERVGRLLVMWREGPLTDGQYDRVGLSELPSENIRGG